MSTKQWRSVLEGADEALHGGESDVEGDGRGIDFARVIEALKLARGNEGRKTALESGDSGMHDDLRSVGDESRSSVDRREDGKVKKRSRKRKRRSEGKRKMKKRKRERDPLDMSGRLFEKARRRYGFKVVVSNDRF